MKILVFATDIIPIPGLPTSGTALRTYGIVQGLRAHGHDVRISVPRNALSGFSSKSQLSSISQDAADAFTKLKELAFDASNQAAIIARLNPDVIVCGHWPAMTLRTKPTQTLIIDLAGPHLLERHFQQTPNHAGATVGKLSALANADYFIVSGPTQRLYFLSFLLRAQVENPETKIITITMPLNPDQPPEHASVSGSFPSFVFGGVFLPWQDPSLGLEAVVGKLEQEKRGKLTLIGGKHPNYPINEGVYGKLFSNLSKSPQVVKKPMLPYEQFVSKLTNADVAIDLMRWNIERELAVTIRSTTYLWAGVPVIYNDFADLGRLIREYDAGWCVSEDKEQLMSVISDIFEHPEMVLNKSKNASRLAREVFSWDKAVAPLLKVLGAGTAKKSRETDIVVDFPDRADFGLYGEHQVEQYFLSRLNGLFKIEFRMATHNRKISGPLHLQLFQLEQQASESKVETDTPRTLVFETEVDGATVKNNEWCSFDLPPVPSSAGKAFVLKMSGAVPAPEESLSPWAVKGSPYPLLGLYYDRHKIQHSSLCIRTTCTAQQ